MDDRMMVYKQERSAREHEKKMERFFQLADIDGDNTIGKRGMREMLKYKEVTTWLASMGLNVDDNELLLRLMTDGDEDLTLSQLVRGIGRLKGPARSLDLE